MLRTEIQEVFILGAHSCADSERMHFDWIFQVRALSSLMRKDEDRRPSGVIVIVLILNSILLNGLC